VRQINSEDQIGRASQDTFGNQPKTASQKIIEDQHPNASQNAIEDQASLASHHKTEDQTKSASQRSVENHNANAADDELRKYVELKRYVDIFYDIQEVRKATANRERGMPKESWIYSEELRRMEEKILNETITPMLKDIPVYRDYLKYIKGIGPTLSAAWIANIKVVYKPVKNLEGCTPTQRAFHLKTKGGKLLVPVLRSIGEFANFSKLCKWCALDVVDGELPKRTYGRKFGRNLKMRVLAWKTRRGFMRKGSNYRHLYDGRKKYLLEESKYDPIFKKNDKGEYVVDDPSKCPRYESCIKRLRGRAERTGERMKKPPCLGHINSMAQHYMIKEGFLKDLYENWRRIEGLPPVPPYPHSHQVPENQLGSASHPALRAT